MDLGRHWQALAGIDGGGAERAAVALTHGTSERGRSSRASAERRGQERRLSHSASWQEEASIEALSMTTSRPPTSRCGVRTARAGGAKRRAVQQAARPLAGCVCTAAWDGEPASVPARHLACRVASHKPPLVQASPPTSHTGLGRASATGCVAAAAAAHHDRPGSWGRPPAPAARRTAKRHSASRCSRVTRVSASLCRARPTFAWAWSYAVLDWRRDGRRADTRG